MPSRFNLGMLLALAGNGGATTYKDPDGVSRACGQLAAGPTGFDVPTNAPVGGRVVHWTRAVTEKLQLAVHLVRVTMTNVHVQVWGRRVDAGNPNLFTWSPVRTTRSDTGADAVKGEHVLAATDPVDLFLMTQDVITVGDLYVTAFADGVIAAGERVFVGGDSVTQGIA